MKQREGIKITETAILWLQNELPQAANQGHIWELEFGIITAILQRKLALKCHTPTSVVDHHSREKLEVHTGDLFQFTSLPNCFPVERESHFFPAKYKYVPISQMTDS